MAVPFAQTTHSLKGDSSRLAHLAWLFAGVLMAVWLGWFCFASVTVYETSDRARLEVRQASHQIDALVAGQVSATSLAIGREVLAGDVLMELNAGADKLRLKEERGRLQAISAQIASLNREIEARQSAKDEDLQAALAGADVARLHGQEADAAVEFAKGTEQRVGKLAATGSSTRVDQMRAAAEVQKLTSVRDAWAAEQVRIERDAQSKGHQNEAQIEALRHAVATLQGDYATAEATIARLGIEIEKHLVRAPVAGRLGDVVPIHAGAYVAEGQRLATVVPPGDLIIVADFVPSTTIGRVRAGQSAHLRLDSFPWAQYGTVPATVASVGSEIRDKSIRVELAVTAAPDTGILMQHGLPGTIEVEIEQASPASLVLRAAGLYLAPPSRRTTTLAELQP